ncbi:hypothetical protein CAEBREN_22419 [Caenorhabditis brenneri]|uniref:G protein-coupled receptor n=1 Tax=Caenorhabditis brenneri TaxID=135651 RepID=G0NL61_CAEBE|nr:hypothetical protein CAEBREN_22419 [Caenorhabditis brenneri]
MYDIDFSIAYWLSTYYHFVGVISLVMDMFSIYLIVFQSDKIDDFRYFLLNFQVACAFTDFHLTGLTQPVPLYPLLAGYVMGVGARFGVTTHFAMTGISFFFSYQIGAMIICFVRKHQSIAGTLKRYLIPKFLLFFMLLYFVTFVLSVPGILSTLNIPESQKLEFVKLVRPQAL